MSTGQTNSAAQDNMKRYNEKVAARGDIKTDDTGFLGPSYSYADELKTPGQIGVRNDGSVGGIIDAVSGINYYIDTIGFGQKTMFNRNDLQPMGIRYFLNTGSVCSNGAYMYDYIDTVPKGNLLGQKVAGAIKEMGLPQMRGLAPGILEDARDALNPLPLINAAIGGGYPECVQVTLPVGDMNGKLRPDSYRDDKGRSVTPDVWIKGDVKMISNRPHQTRWIQAVDGKGNKKYLTKEQWEAAPKQFYPDGKPIEGFQNSPAFWEEYIDKKTAAGLLLIGVALGFTTYVAHK